ncbi:TIGR02391 family protein, partial [Enterococcus faecium]|nr:TIGR02391 family protein [Enterococcus faecium]
MRLRRNKNYTTIILEDFTDQELLIVGKTKADFIEKGNASIVKASKVAVEKYFDSLEESAKEIFNRIRQKSPILYRWVMNAVRYEGYR